MAIIKDYIGFDENRNKVLIASDNISGNSIVSEVLSGERLIVTEKTTLKESLKYAVNELPDIIITFSDNNSFAKKLTAEINNNSLTKTISVIVVTGNDEQEKAEAVSWNISDLVSYPPGKSELLFRIEKILKERKMIPDFNMSTYEGETDISDWYNDNDNSDNAIDSKKPVVLVVDDNKLIRTQLKDYVEALGYRALTAEGGKEAFKITQKNKLDLILMDIVLPDLGGMELLEMVRQQKNLLQLPVIMISGLSDSDSKLKSLEIGADDYISKPIHYKELQAKMKTVLRKKFYFEEVTKNYHLAVKRAITDSLTELYNHGYFHEFLEREIKRCRRYHHHLSLIIGDIDYFKNYNDVHGHPRGDVVLKRTAEILVKSTRSTDHVARYGGEEFAIVLPETELTSAVIVAEKIRFTMEKEDFQGQETQPGGNLTISLGVSSIPPREESIDITKLIKKADQALYEAKRLGRNRVVSLSIES